MSDTMETLHEISEQCTEKPSTAALCKLAQGASYAMYTNECVSRLEQAALKKTMWVALHGTEADEVVVDEDGVMSSYGIPSDNPLNLAEWNTLDSLWSLMSDEGEKFHVSKCGRLAVTVGHAVRNAVLEEVLSSLGVWLSEVSETSDEQGRTAAWCLDDAVGLRDLLNITLSAMRPLGYSPDQVMAGMKDMPFADTLLSMHPEAYDRLIADRETALERGR